MIDDFVWGKRTVVCGESRRVCLSHATVSPHRCQPTRIFLMTDLPCLFQVTIQDSPPLQRKLSDNARNIFILHHTCQNQGSTQC